ncbi:MAG: hypothetical protein M1570_03620 [Chloroflexi bacterium]|nr:hypothetical protein [Chloroflexota bacterium]
MILADFPQPPANNGRGLHGTASNQRFPDPWDYWLNEICEMGIKWFKLLDDGGSNVDFAKELLHRGVMPVIRLYIDAPNPGRITDYARVDEVAVIRRYVAAGIRYFEINNEPNLGNEWHIPYPPDAPEMTMDNWLPDAELVISLGGLPAFPALAQTQDPRFNSVNWCRRAFAYLKSHYADRAAAVFSSGAWLAVHAALLNHPLDYPYDAINQRDHPRATAFTDDCCLLGYRVPLDILKETFGLSAPVISTEGGVFAPGPSGSTTWDTRYPAITKQTHATNTVAMFQWMMDQSPAEFFGMCPWLIFGGGNPAWDYDSWYRRNEILPVVAALKGMPNYAKKNPVGAVPKPSPGLPPASVDVANIARGVAWSALKITLNPDAALFKKAKELQLGHPVTNEIPGVMIGGVRCVVQGFANGILYAKEGDWGNIQMATWM